MGTCTVAIKKRTGISATGRTVIADVTLSSSYSDNGDTVRIADFGMKTLSALVLCSNAAVPTGGADVTGRALVVTHGANEVTDPLLLCYQQGSAAGPLTEVAAGTNLSTVTVRVIAFGDLVSI
jgi:hypothetical protein